MLLDFLSVDEYIHEIDICVRCSLTVVFLYLFKLLGLLVELLIPLQYGS